MNIEKEALFFVEKMEELYLTKRDIKQLLTQMQTDTSWLGTGKYEVCHNFLDAQEALEKEFDEYNGSFQIVEQNLYTTKVSDTVCIVYGSLHVIPEDNQVEEQSLHLTAICKKAGHGMKLLHCNLSRPDTLQEDNHYYVPPKTRADNKELRKTLESREKQLQNLTHNIPGGVHQCKNDASLTLMSMSEGFGEMFDYTREDISELFDNKYINMIHPDDREIIIKDMYNQLLSGPTIELEYRVLRKNKEPIWTLDKGRLVEDENGDKCFYCMLIDITERKREQELLRLSLERHQIIMDQADDIIFEWNIISDTLVFSSNWNKKFGYNAINQQISQRIPLSQNIHPDDMPAFIKIMKDTTSGIPYSETEFRIRDAHESYSWNRIRATTLFNDNGDAIKAIGVISDITSEKEERLALMEQAQKDALTGLYNKSAIKSLVEKKMGRQSLKDEKQALLIIDLDNFKNINDTYGHFCGDSILSTVSEILKLHFYTPELVGRIGGDEFLVYIPTVTDENIISERAHKLCDDMKKIYPSPNAYPLTCSIGIAIFPIKEVNYFSFYQCADRALYHQKSIGRNGVFFYDSNSCNEMLSYSIAHSAVSQSIDSEKVGAVEEELVQYTFEMLYQSIDVEIAVNNLLEIVGRAYGVSRVYIFENSEDELSCNNTFEWCAAGIPSEMETLQGIRYKEDLGGYHHNFNDEGVFYCHDICTLNSELYNVLAPQGIRSLLQCAILDRGQFKGYVGFDECKENCFWSKDQIRSLTLIANTLSVFLVKLRLQEQLDAQSRGNLRKEL